jgi:acyl-CoA synthetase (AMP-forming)/AMP-acid ligase II
MRVNTLVELLGERALRSPERLAYVFLRDGEIEAARLVFGELDRRARVVAATLQRLKAQGERALLFYSTGEDFVTAFFGCMYAAVVAVPVPPPGLGRLTRALPRLQAIIHDSQARLVLTTSRVCALLPTLVTAAPDLEALHWQATDTLPSDGHEEWIDPRVDSNSIAFLQYTSGSTANPKGVVITHANILSNEAAIQKRFGNNEDTVCVSWLPMYHDMGLIGAVLGTFYGGGKLIVMSPEAFLQQPARWLRAVSHYRADLTGGPNFAFDHCLARVTAEQRATLDLSSWRIAVTGAEPVRADTLERFARTFEPCGFRREAFYPCYGLAESTLLASAGTRHTPPVVRTLRPESLERGLAVDATGPDHADPVRRVVGCGRSLDDQRIAIVDPESRCERHPCEIGEIWVSGPSVAGGYWNQREETERVFRARLFGVDDRVYLRTGDLGFIDDEGNLFVTGRLKDLIIIDGRNHYPQDIERTVEAADPALQPGACAAFSIDAGGEERLVIAAEVQRRKAERHDEANADETVRKIRRAVAEVHGVEVHAVRLLRPGSIPKTSSGKLRRLACRDAFVTGTLDAAGGEANVPA